jgi:hypothetical protein
VYHMMGNVGSRALILKKALPNAKILLTIRRQPEYFISIFSYFQQLERWHLNGKMRSIKNMLNVTDPITSMRIHHRWGVPLGMEIERKLATYSIDEKYFNRHWRNFMVAAL